MDLQLSARSGRNCTVVRVGGELDIDTGPALQEFVRDIVDAGDRHLVLDLSEVSFMDSGGLGALVSSYELARSRDRRLHLAAVQNLVRYVLAVTTVDRAVEVFETVEAAEERLPAGPV